MRAGDIDGDVLEDRDAIVQSSDYGEVWAKDMREVICDDGVVVRLYGECNYEFQYRVSRRASRMMIKAELYLSSEGCSKMEDR